MGNLKNNMMDLAIEKLLIKNLSEPIFAEVRKPLNESKVALITTAGVHLKSQKPFDGKKGDASFRVIPADVNSEEIMITHGHYDQSEAEKDVNCVLPIDRLNELSKARVIGGVATNHYGFMGFAPEVKPLMEEYAPEVARLLVEDGVDVAIFSPA